MAQQGEMDAELQRLHRVAEEQAQAAIQAAQDNAAVMARVQQHGSRAQELDTKMSKLQAAVRAADARAIELAQQLSQTRSQLVSSCMF